jgi:uncharacterized membrane protein
MATDGSVAASGITVQLSTPGHTAIAAVTDPSGNIDSGAPGNGWVALLGGSAIGDYALTIDAASNPGLGRNGKLALGAIQNIALLLGYEFSPKGSDFTRRFTTIDAPGAASTFAQGKNDRGQIVGSIRDSGGLYHSLLTDAKSFTTFDPPAAVGSPAISFALGINANGDIVGFVSKPDLNQPRSQAYIKRGDAFTFYSHPNADPLRGTQFDGINDAGKRVGAYIDAADVSHAFIQDDHATTVLESLPGMPANKGSFLFAINNGGQMVGGYFDAVNDVQHGLLYDGKVFSTVDYPGSDTTWLNSINAIGQMAGGYFDAVAQVFRGFITDGKSFRVIDFPNLPPGHGTFLTGIDDSGRIVGYYGAEVGLEGVLGRKAMVRAFVAEPLTNAPLAVLASGKQAPTISGLGNNRRLAGTVSSARVSRGPRFPAFG